MPLGDVRRRPTPSTHTPQLHHARCSPPPRRGRRRGRSRARARRIDLAGAAAALPALKAATLDMLAAKAAAANARPPPKRARPPSSRRCCTNLTRRPTRRRPRRRRRWCRRAGAWPSIRRLRPPAPTQAAFRPLITSSPVRTQTAAVRSHSLRRPARATRSARRRRGARSMGRAWGGGRRRRGGVSEEGAGAAAAASLARTRTPTPRDRPSTGPLQAKRTWASTSPRRPRRPSRYLRPPGPRTSLAGLSAMSTRRAWSFRPLAPMACPSRSLSSAFNRPFNYVGAADLPTVGKIRKGGGREGRATHALARRTRPTNPSFFLQWDPASSTLLGNVNGSPPGTDTQGAAGYFVPTRAISTLSFSGVNILGSPSHQVWFADFAC